MNICAKNPDRTQCCITSRMLIINVIKGPDTAADFSQRILSGRANRFVLSVFSDSRKFQALFFEAWFKLYLCCKINPTFLYTTISVKYE